MTANCPLNEKDLQLIRKLSSGMTRQELAKEMRVSSVMVCKWVADIAWKAKIRRKDTAIVATAIRNGWIE